MQTRITTRVIIYYQNKILLCRNQGQDFWYPGGGGWKENEDLKECCVREALEETGQKIKVIDLMYVQEYYWREKGKRSMELFFLAEPKGKIQKDKNHRDTDTDDRLLVEENRWLSQEDIKKNKIKVYPKFIKEQFWQDIVRFDKDRKIYWKSIGEE